MARLYGNVNHVEPIAVFEAIVVVSYILISPFAPAIWGKAQEEEAR